MGLRGSLAGALTEGFERRNSRPRSFKLRDPITISLHEDAQHPSLSPLCTTEGSGSRRPPFDRAGSQFLTLVTSRSVRPRTSQCPELGPVAVRSGGLFGEDPLAARRQQSIRLERRVLVHGGNAGISDEHDGLFFKLLHCTELVRQMFQSMSFSNSYEVTGSATPLSLSLADISLYCNRYLEERISSLDSEA